MSTIILITLNPYYTDQLHVKFVIRKLNATLPSSVSRRGLGIAARKTRTCFLTSGYSLTDNYFRCGIYVLISSMSGERSIAAPKPPSQVSADIFISGRNSISGTVIIHHDLPCSWPRDHGGRWPYTRTGQNGRRIGFPGRWDGTQLSGQIGATYVMVWIRVHIYYQQFRQTIAYLLRRIWADCRS